MFFKIVLAKSSSLIVALSIISISSGMEKKQHVGQREKSAQLQSLFDHAIKLVGQQNFFKAHQLFEQAGAQGHVESYLALAGMCEEGFWGKVKDERQALHYYQLAYKKDQNCGIVLHGLGVYYAHGKANLPVDKARAKQLWLQGAQSGDLNCSYELGVCAALDEPRDIDRAIYYFEQAASARAEACFNLGALYLAREKVDLAIERYKQAALKGHVDALPQLLIIKQQYPQYRSVIEAFAHDFSRRCPQAPDLAYTFGPLVAPATLVLPVDRCEQCLKTKQGANVVLRKCSCCTKVAYCSKECQRKHWPTHKVHCQARLEYVPAGAAAAADQGAAVSQQLVVCSKCGVSSPDLKKCSRCKMVAYCDEKCQRIDWKKHRKSCKVVISHSDTSGKAGGGGPA